MQPRILTLFGLIAFFAVVISINAEEEGDEVEVENRANPAVAIVAKMIGSLFAGAAASCLTEAASQCKEHWRHIHAATSCAKNFLAVNKGRCAVG